MASISKSQSTGIYVGETRPAINTLTNNNSHAYENYAELTRAYSRLSNLRDTLAGYGENDSENCLEECMPSGIVDYAARVNRDTSQVVADIHQIINEISSLLN